MNLELINLIRKKKDERVIFFLRRHFIIFFGELLYVALLAAIPVGGYFIINLIWPTLLAGSMSRPTAVLVASAYYLVIWLFFIGSFVDYYLDAWVVTDQRILNVEQNGIFARTVSELDLARVQDVTSEVKGIIPSIFRYGYVYIQTAGERERFVFEQIPQPHEVRKRLLELVEADQSRTGFEFVETMRGAKPPQ